MCRQGPEGFLYLWIFTQEVCTVSYLFTDEETEAQSYDVFLPGTTSFCCFRHMSPIPPAHWEDRAHAKGQEY